MGIMGLQFIILLTEAHLRLKHLNPCGTP